MTYSDETMSVVDRALKARASGELPSLDFVKPVGHEGEHHPVRVGVVKSSELGDDWTAESHLPNIGDTCCGNCGAGLCYVDGVTGV